jgi:hypothetical protein
MKHQNGFANPNAILTDSEVITIQALWKTGHYTQEFLARQYDVNQSQISRIVNGLRRRHKSS